ncbi:MULTISPECIES: GntR family transcriptional regulator [Bordetella]|uniref:GntR family transcriptional regulator n=2 Tax=Bordetella TaxID=517 RepID=A0A261W224_9BORD|nr:MULTISPECIES: GntR family transcriptional regulator [Bordetella]MDM9558609.1 GntR family transcriptional regulator [Bordetella petrii]OZI79792.1 GntR family transcriptional regulator [Bordetella genomosp. 2]
MASSASTVASLDRSSAHPLHAQVAQALRREIGGRRLAPGTALPSEAALCRQFGVARSVVRQALAALVAEGAIRREPGRAPTVAPPLEHHRMVQRSTGLFEQFASIGTALRTRVLRCEPATAPPDVAAFFGTADALLLERLRSVDDETLAFVRTWLPRARLPGLAAEHLHDASLHRTLAQRFGLHPGRGRNRIRAVGADATLARALGVPSGSPLLMLEGQGFDQDGRPLEWFTTWHRAEKLVFDVDVSPAGEQIQPALPDAPAGAPAGFQPDASLEAVEQALCAALDQVRRLRGKA